MSPKARLAVISVAATLNILNVVFPPVEIHSNLFTSLNGSERLRSLPATGSGIFHRKVIWTTFRPRHEKSEDSRFTTYYSFRIEWASMLSLSAIISWTAWLILRFEKRD